jgi:hypothetical protein
MKSIQGAAWRRLPQSLVRRRAASVLRMENPYRRSAVRVSGRWILASKCLKVLEIGSPGQDGSRPVRTGKQESYETNST